MSSGTDNLSPSAIRMRRLRRQGLDIVRQNNLDFAVHLAAVADAAPNEDIKREIHRIVHRLRRKSPAGVAEARRAANDFALDLEAFAGRAPDPDAAGDLRRAAHRLKLRCVYDVTQQRGAILNAIRVHLDGAGTLVEIRDETGLTRSIVRAVLTLLISGGVVRRFTKGGETCYRIE